MHSTLRQALHSLYWGQSFWVVEGEFCVLISIFLQNCSNKTTSIARKAVLLHRFLEWCMLHKVMPLTDIATQ